MKLIYILILNILLVFVSCDKVFEPQSIKLSTTEITAISSCDTLNIFVTANCEWTIYGKSDWCRPLIESGNGNNIVSIIINHSEEDTIRYAIFEFKTNDQSSKAQLKINQKPGYLLELDAKSDTIIPEGGIIGIPFITNYNNSKIVLPSSINWIHEMNIRSLHNDTVYIVVDENTGNERMAQIELHYGEKIKLFEIVQRKCIPLEKIVFCSGLPEYSYGEIDIQVECNFIPENATNKKLLWSSSNDKLCSVTQDGLVHTFPIDGNCEIMAKNVLNNVYTKYSIKCYNPKTPIKIEQLLSTLLQNSSIQLSVNKPHFLVKWFSDDVSLAVVNDIGIIRASSNKIGFVNIYSRNLNDNSIDSRRVEIVDLIANAHGGHINSSSNSSKIWLVADIVSYKNVVINSVLVIDNNGTIRYTSLFSDFENNYSTSVKFRSGCIILNSTMGDATLKELSTWWMKITYSIDNGATYKNKEVFINSHYWGGYN